MVVHDLDVEGISARPAKADAPAVVDTNAVLPLAVSVQSLEAIPGRRAEEFERSGGMEHRELAFRLRPDREPPAWALTCEKRPSILVGECFDHKWIVCRVAFNVKR